MEKHIKYIDSKIIQILDIGMEVFQVKVADLQQIVWC